MPMLRHRDTVCTPENHTSDGLTRSAGSIFGGVQTTEKMPVMSESIRGEIAKGPAGNNVFRIDSGKVGTKLTKGSETVHTLLL